MKRDEVDKTLYKQIKKDATSAMDDEIVAKKYDLHKITVTRIRLSADFGDYERMGGEKDKCEETVNTIRPVMIPVNPERQFEMELKRLECRVEASVRILNALMSLLAVAGVIFLAILK